MEIKSALRWELLAIVSLCAGVSFVFLSGVLGNGPKSKTSAAAVEAEQVQIFAGGIVEGTSAPLALRFESAGRVKRVLVREGDEVQTGQVLAELETEAAELRLSQAEAELKVVQVERNRLISGVNPQAQNVLVSGSSTQDAIAIASARATGALAVVKQAQLQLRKTRLVAPASGIMVSVPLSTGDLTGPDGAAEPLLLVNRDQTRVRAFVEELDAMDVAVGQSALVVASARAEKKYCGTILSCAPYMRPKSHKHLDPGERLDVRVREIIIELEDGADLLIGLPVEVFIGPDAAKTDSGKTDATPDSESPAMNHEHDAASGKRTPLLPKPAS